MNRYTEKLMNDLPGFDETHPSSSLEDNQAESRKGVNPHLIMQQQESKPRLTLTHLLTAEDILKSAPTKQLLLGHGIRLFHRFGAGGTSIGRLLQVSGKSKSQFYSHFKNKDDFICQILELQMTTMIKISRRNKLETPEDFVKWFDPYLELANLPDNLGCPVGPLATEQSPSNDTVRNKAIEQFERWKDSIAEALDTMASNGQFPESFDANSTARHMCCGIQGAFLFCRVYQDTSFLVDVRDRFAQQFVDLQSA